MSQTQFHHFIPQFILRNFSHPYHYKSALGSKSRNKKNKIHPGQPALYTIDLKNETPQLCDAPVRRTFGLMDMYRDVSDDSDYYIVEKELSKLESRVSTIVTRIKKAFESSDDGVSMSRDERDTLRKFLFIMKYRGTGFYERFRGDRNGNYVENDAHQFKKYMIDNGYRNPMKVWFKTIKTILNLQLDPQGTWKDKLLADIYLDDARWFILHVEGYYLTFCTPCNTKDEFILTENCYNVHEGPNSTLLNLTTGELEVTTWSSYHEFAPIAPRLILVLRSFVLPNAEEDVSERIKIWRRTIYERCRSHYENPDAAKSVLEDLPLRKPQNSYSQILPKGIQLLPGEDGTRRSSHRFTFPFIQISTNQVHRINCILLDNAHLTSVIAFTSQQSLKESLAYYLQLPADRGYKVVHGLHDMKLAYLKKLESIAIVLGSDVTMSCREILNSYEMKAAMKESQEQLQKVLLENLPEQPTDFMKLYQKLGGSGHTIIADVDQVEKMRFLRIKVDVATKGFPDATRTRAQENLRDLFCQSIPARRLWLYVKQLREMSLRKNGEHMEFFNGPEDVIVKVCHIVRPECLSLLLYFTVMQDIGHRLNPGLNPSSEFDLDRKGYDILQKITNLTFAPIGSIRDCGIKPLQRLAIQISNILRLTKSYERQMHPAWSIEENIEILTRVLVRKDMMSLLHGLGKVTAEELSDVLFNVVYPTYRQGSGD